MSDTKLNNPDQLSETELKPWLKWYEDTCKIWPKHVNKLKKECDEREDKLDAVRVQLQAKTMSQLKSLGLQQGMSREDLSAVTALIDDNDDDDDDDDDEGFVVSGPQKRLISALLKLNPVHQDFLEADERYKEAQAQARAPERPLPRWWVEAVFGDDWNRIKRLTMPEQYVSTLTAATGGGSRKFGGSGGGKRR